MWEENSCSLKVIWTKSLLNATRGNKKEEDGAKICWDTGRGHVCSPVKQPGNLLSIFANIWAYNQERSIPCPWGTGLDFNIWSGDPQAGAAGADGQAPNTAKQYLDNFTFFWNCITTQKLYIIPLFIWDKIFLPVWFWLHKELWWAVQCCCYLWCFLTPAGNEAPHSHSLVPPPTRLGWDLKSKSEKSHGLR